MEIQQQKQNTPLSFWTLIGHIKELIPIIALVVALIVGWINLKNELKTISEKQLSTDARLIIVESDQNKLNDTLSRVNENLASINTALEFIKQKVNQ